MRHALAFPALLLLAACGETYADVHRDELVLIRGMVETLESVHDDASAAAATRQLAALPAKSDALAQRMRALGEVDDSTRSAVEEDHAEERKALAQRFMAAMQRITTHEDLVRAVSEAMRGFDF